MGTRKLRQPASEPADPKPDPGRVVFDSRGNPVWEWNTAAGDSTSVLLKQLDNDELALEPTRAFRAIGERDRPTRKPAKSAKRADNGEPFELEKPGNKGFDPYNRS